MKILFINANIRGNKSRTLELTKYFLKKYKQKYNDIKIEELDLSKEDIKPIMKKELEQREFFISNKIYNDQMFKYAKQFKEADKIIISAPCWDYSFPSILKIYIENISVLGITFKYDLKGSIGLSKFNSLLYITTVGGDIYDNSYIKNISQFFGNGKYYEVLALGLDTFGNDVNKILNDAKLKLDELVEVF